MGSQIFTFLIFSLNLINEVSAKQAKQPGKCAKYAEDVNFHHPLMNNPAPNPMGVWVSSRCEIVPKPKYILRRLDIQTTTWTGRIYHYKDSWCSTPSFLVKAIGTYDILPTTATPNAKASYAAIFYFGNVYFNAAEFDVLEGVITFILGKCPNALPSIASMQKESSINLEEFQGKDIKLNVEALMKSKHCRYYFALHRETFKKIRMTREKVGTSVKFTREYDKLYFAAIPSFHSNYRYNNKIPINFQYDLSRINRPNCQVCEMLSRKEVNPDNIPKLKPPRYRKYFSGSWVTEVCMAADDTTFQTEFYQFKYDDDTNKESGTVIYHQNMFKDSDCTDKRFNMKIGGTFQVLGSTGISGVYEVRLDFTSMSLNIYSETMISLARNAKCGVSKKWRIGVEQNLTESNGCQDIGFKIPATVKTILRVAKSRHSQELSIVEAEEKGTYFSSNLVSCETVTKDFKEKTTTSTPEVVPRVIPEDKDFTLDRDKDYTNPDLGKVDKNTPGSAGITSHRTTSFSLVSSMACIVFLSLYFA